MLSAEAILYYADHPVEFVEDIIRATPDPERSGKPYDDRAKRPRRRKERSRGVGSDLVYLHSPIP